MKYHTVIHVSMYGTVLDLVSPAIAVIGLMYANLTTSSESAGQSLGPSNLVLLCIRQPLRPSFLCFHASAVPIDGGARFVGAELFAG
ncbi:MAG: hypothetical protein OXC68_01775 [Aestuariivita sp.]|nr:hypothetical protein [Aestuariivita sp.]